MDGLSHGLSLPFQKIHKARLGDAYFSSWGLHCLFEESMKQYKTLTGVSKVQDSVGFPSGLDS
jgi:hypothetical protein